jgi:hypothetical protein
MAMMMMMCGLLICSSILVLYVETAALATVETSGNSFFQSVDPESKQKIESELFNYPRSL